MAYKGRYKPKNPQKYDGDVSKIIYRSLWERRLMKFLDLSKNCLKWSSEEYVVQYYDPTTKKKRWYYPDFVATFRKKDNSVETWMIEVKPEKQTRMPKHPGRTTSKYLKECKRYAVNEAKWNAAIKFCDRRGWKFKIMTEKYLG